MSVVEIAIADGTISARDHARAISWTSADEVVLRGTRILAIGSTGDPEGGEAPNELRSRRAAFDLADFSADLAAAVLRFAVHKVTTGRISFSRPEVRIQWAGWDRIPVADRRVLVRQIGSGHIDINRVPVVRPAVDIPILGALLGDRVRLNADGPWQRRTRGD